MTMTGILYNVLMYKGVGEPNNLFPETSLSWCRCECSVRWSAVRDVHMFDVTEILRLSARLTPLSLTVWRVRAESRDGLHNNSIERNKNISLNFAEFSYVPGAGPSTLTVREEL